MSFSRTEREREPNRHRIAEFNTNDYFIVETAYTAQDFVTSWTTPFADHGYGTMKATEAHSWINRDESAAIAGNMYMEYFVPTERI